MITRMLSHTAAVEEVQGSVAGAVCATASGRLLAAPAASHMEAALPVKGGGQRLAAI